MNWIIQGLVSLIAGVASYFGRKTATVAAVIIAFVTITAAFFLAVKALVFSLVATAVIPASILLPVSLIITPKIIASLGAVMSARAIKRAYLLAVEKLRLISSSN